MTIRPLRFAALLAVAAFLAGNARADQHPNTARGFDIGKPYQMNGIDNINLFNGNLTVTLPVGQRYHVNGNLSYGLTLVYSGNVWDTVVDHDTRFCNGHNEPTTKSYPNRRSNAGMGWVLSLGRLFPLNQFPVQESPTWNYETPDGGLHAFATGLHSSNDPCLTESIQCYTRDGSYIRMTKIVSQRKVEFPDGTSQIFEEMGDNPDGTWPVSPDSGKWRLTAINDRFGNSVAIAYSSKPATITDPNYPEIWTITDGTRTEKVYFKATGTSFYETAFEKAVLSTFNTTSGEWKAGYDYKTLPLGGIDHSQCNDQPGPPVTVPLLTSLTLPPVDSVSQVYSMVATDGVTPNYYLNNSTNALNGHLKGLQLPTKGWIEWDSIRYSYYGGTEQRFNRSIVVTTRRTVSADRNTTATWTYTRAPSANLTCFDPITQTPYSAPPEQLLVAVTSPEQVTSVNYFSTYAEVGLPCTVTSSIDPVEYSLPFTRAVTKVDAHQTTWYLSSEVYTGTPTLTTGTSGYRASGGTLHRSEWIRYDYDGDSYEASVWNGRETARATYYEDDPHCSVPPTACYASVTRYGFDGAGHFRQSSTGGNFPTDASSHGNFKTTFTKYPDINTTGTWLLNTYTEHCAIDETSERFAGISQCSALGSAALTSQSCFDSTNGFLKRTRALSGLRETNGTNTSTNDVVAVYTQQAGNVTQEDFYGGDTQSFDDLGNDLCSVSLPTGGTQYSVANTYQSGALATSRYLPTNTHLTNPSFYSVFNTIDSNTGLTKNSAEAAPLDTSWPGNPAPQTTLYDYDVLGRITSVTPTGEAAVAYAYTEATSGTPPQVTVTRISNQASNGDTTAQKTIQATTIFDSFGRISKEQKLLPAGTATKETRYTGSGWTERVSEWEATPSNFTVFSNFDAFGRPGTITGPGQPSVGVTTMNYFGSRKVERTVTVGETLSGTTVQQSSAKTTETYDRLGRLITVDEPDAISSAAYLHDAADRLTSVTMTDPDHTQPSRIFAYDGRGLLKSEQHLENGTTFYKGYDARGHVGRKLAGQSYSAFDLKYEYDAAERLTTVYQLLNRVDAPSQDQTQLLKQFTFATANAAPNYKLGKLETATRRNYSPAGTIDVKETYGYSDSAGRLTDKTTEVTGTGSGLLQKYAQGYTYNDFGLFSQITYPTCPEPTRPCATPSSMISSVSPTYQNGLLKTVPNFTTAVTYDVNGMVTEIDHPGSVNDLITVDPNKIGRPARIQFNSYDQCASPQITLPATKQVNSGPPGLQVTVIGSPTLPLTYQWLKDGTVIPTETSSSCCSAAATSGTYTARAINSCGKGEASTVVTVCGSPTVTVSPQSATYSGSGQAITLTAAPVGCSPFTYQWHSGTVGSGPSIAGQTSITYAAAPSSTTQYWVRVTDTSGGTADSNAATITVPLCTPQIQVQPQNKAVDYGTQVQVSVTATGCTGKVYSWYSGQSGDTSTLLGGGFYNTPSITFTPPDHGPIWVQIYGDFIAAVNSTTAMMSVRPIAVNAHVTTGTSINITWQAHAHHYLLKRCSNTCDQPVAVFPSGFPLSYTDTSASADKTYVYSVASVDVYGNISAYSVPDIATTMSFTPVQQNGVINRAHINELFTALNRMRVAIGWPTVTWAEILPSNVPAPPAAGQPTVAVYAAHITSLRAQMNAVLSSLGIATTSYTDSLTTPTPIKAIHFTELQDRTK